MLKTLAPRLLLALLLLSLAAAPAHAQDAATTTTATTATTVRLERGWEFTRTDLGGLWEAWRSAKISASPAWQPVALPHCFNALDAVDPDCSYYQGPGWYRIQLPVSNPYPGGRTLLFFEGAGQKTDVFVYLDKVGSHVGGYDQFTVDITDAVADYLKNPMPKGGETVELGAKPKSSKGKAKTSPKAKPGKGSAKTQAAAPAASAPAEAQPSAPAPRIPIAVRCDNSRDLELIPSQLSDFGVYGGLYRAVELRYVPAVSLERVHIKPELSGPNGKVAVALRLYNPTKSNAPVKLSLRLLAPSGRQVFAASETLAPWAGERSLFSTVLPKAVLWSTDDPRLYSCEVTLDGPGGRQTLTRRFGFRSFEFVEHGPFKLNGQRLLLRGTHRHHDHAGLGAAMPADLIRKEMTLMKEMGANFIRLGHYQQPEQVLDLCDELGLLVWEEIPWCRGGVGGPAYKQQARDMLAAMIDQHSNHPAVILWGLGNENDWPGDQPTFDQRAVRAFMTELDALAHKLDPTRLTTIRRCDFCKDVVDVYSPSIWAGWYRGTYPEYKAETEKWIKDVPRFFHAEWGGDSHAGRHSENPDQKLVGIRTGGGADERAGDFKMSGGDARASKDGDWSESYICNLFDWHLKEQETMPNLTGAAQWIFKDFMTPLRPENPVPYVNQKGVVARDLTPKESYYVFQSYWATRPMLHVYGHTWPVRWGKAGEKKMLKAYSNCDTVELFLNGKSLGVKKRNSQDFPAAGLRWEAPLKAGKNEVRAVGRKGDVQVTDRITFEYETRAWGQPARLELKQVAADQETATVEAAAFDAAGVPCLDAATLVRFGLAGEGKLIDDQGTPDGSRAVQLANGRARIRVKTNKGASVVSVSAPGLPTTFVTLGQ